MSDIPHKGQGTVAVETPFTSGSNEKLRKYALMCFKDCTRRYNEAAIMPILGYSQTLAPGFRDVRYTGDGEHDQYGLSRTAAMRQSLEIKLRCDAVVFYVDFGYTYDMGWTYEQAGLAGVTLEERRLPADWLEAVRREYLYMRVPRREYEAFKKYMDDKTPESTIQSRMTDRRLHGELESYLNRKKLVIKQ
jgi:hypothetical protein